MAEQPNVGGVYVQFYDRPVLDKEKTAKEGRQCFKDATYIRKIVAGDPKNEVDRPANQNDYTDFPGAYEAYKKKSEAMEGTPLKEWPAINRSQVEELAAFKVYTVEQLASVSDGNLKNIGPLLALRQKARDFIDRAKADAPIASLQAQVDALVRQNAELQKQVDAKRKG